VIHRPEELFPRLRWSAFCGRASRGEIFCSLVISGPREQGACTMSSGIVRIVVRGLAFSVVLATCAAVRPVSSAPAGDQSAGEGATSRLNPEVRLRKLHLVRPDLIPYPVCYEVYC
jgi:hypothetical protein